MKQTRQILTAFLFATVLLPSCKKDESSSMPTSQGDLLIGTWMNVSLTAERPYWWTNTFYSTDGYTYLGECAKGSYLTFDKGTGKTSGTYSIFDNCTNTKGQGEWSLVNDNQLDIGGSMMKIERLDAINLVYSYTAFDKDKTAIKMTAGFKKK